MKSLDQICDAIVGREGGFVNDPADRGGPTQWGVSLTFARSLQKVDGKWPMDLNGDGVVDIEDIRLVTKEIAKGLYLKHFFYGSKIDKLPAAIQPVLFDMAVNAGGGGAAKVLRLALVASGQLCAIDGSIGPQTLSMTSSVLARIGEKAFVNAIVAARITYYQNIVARDPSQRRFINGWTARAEGFRQ